MVIWIIGKSGAGKSEIGGKLYSKIKMKIPNIVFLDGDTLRDAISEDLGHSVEDRYISEERRSRLCELLAEQGIHVICSALSNAPDIRKWNKENIKDYYEVYLQTDKKSLYKRDPKGIYRKFLNKEINNVVGEDILFHEPETPWMVIRNNGSKNCEEIAEEIHANLKMQINIL